MSGNAGTSGVGAFTVVATTGRGLNSHEIAKGAMGHILHIADTAPPELKAQAEAFQDRVYHVLVSACMEAKRAERTDLYNLFNTKGHSDMAEIIRTL